MAEILPAIFDEPVATAELDPFRAPATPLPPEEDALLERAVPARRLEFSAGRECARRAMSRLGASGPVLRAADRSPIWPTGIVGSIAHTRRGDHAFCGAAVALTSAVRSIGLDVEVEAPLEPKLWRRVLVPNEIAWISGEPESDRGFWAMFVFSAKECVYKCQHPLSRTFLEFADVEVERPMAEGEFRATLLKHAAPFSRGNDFVGRFVRRQGLIATGITLLADRL